MKSIWKGSITFGLVNIPVEMFSASVAREVKFHMLHKKDLSPIRYARICEKEGKEIPWNEIVKGTENEQGKMVVMTAEEIKKSNAPNSHMIEIIQFVKEDEIESVYYDKPYILKPQKGSDKAYSLLKEALIKSKKVGLARFTLHGREHLAVVKQFEDFIIINQLRYAEEIVELKSPKASKVPSKELSIAVKLIDQMTGKFKPGAYADSYIKSLKKTIKGKKGQTIAAEAKKTKSPKVHDMMTLLKASLEKTG